MAMIIDGRIPGGPTTPDIQAERTKHRSTLVYSGECFDHKDYRSREHGMWRNDRCRKCSWELNDAHSDLVRRHEFQWIDQIRFPRHDAHLLLYLIERWWPSRHCFQLPFGEMNVTLEDVAQILGIPITGTPVIFGEDMTPACIIVNYLGVEPLEDISTRSSVKFSWLRDNFMDLGRTATGQVSITQERVVACTRAYLLALCGAILFPNAKGNVVTVRLLPMFMDLNVHTPFAWGAAALAHLYSSLDDYVSLVDNGSMNKNICGCITLLQVWSFVRFHVGRPVPRNDHLFSVGVKWMPNNTDYCHAITHTGDVYRPMFEALRVDEVNWSGYQAPSDDASLLERTTLEQSLHRYFVIYDHKVMYHPTDRVMRQFGFIQPVPGDPLHYQNSTVKFSRRVPALQRDWAARFELYGIATMGQEI